MENTIFETFEKPLEVTFSGLSIPNSVSKVDFSDDETKHHVFLIDNEFKLRLKNEFVHTSKSKNQASHSQTKKFKSQKSIFWLILTFTHVCILRKSLLSENAFFGKNTKQYFTTFQIYHSIFLPISQCDGRGPQIDLWTLVPGRR